MGHQQERHLGGRLLQQFQDGVASVAVHLIRRIDNHHPPAAIGRRQAQKTAQFAHLRDGDFAAQAVLVVIPRTADQRQPGFGQGVKPVGDRVCVRDVERFGLGWGEKAAVSLGRGQQKPRQTPRQSGFANTFGPGNCPGVVHPARVEGGKEARLGGVVAEKLAGQARMRGILQPVGFGNIGQVDHMAAIMRWRSLQMGDGKAGDLGGNGSSLTFAVDQPKPRGTGGKAQKAHAHFALHRQPHVLKAHF